MLELSQVTAGYGAFTALWDVSLRVNSGEAVAVVGPNGAGKTTLLRAISGLVRPSAGRVRMNGTALEHRPAHDIVRLGMAHVPEGRHVFARLSVADNLRLGAYTVRDRRTFERRKGQVVEMFPVLRDLDTQRAGNLSGGEQQMLAIGRALMSGPQLLLLDEPTLGIAPLLVAKLFDALKRLPELGTAVLLVEQNVREALEIAQSAYVLQTGRVVLTGQGRELLGSDLVRQAYLGL
jgi:branched-chain amino acid transport system ATP-binding protein